jgi:type II secretory pathway component PulM
MTSYLDKLNLRPSEKRLVVVVGAVIFVVLNFWFVIPRFSDWTRVKNRMAQARQKLAMFEAEARQLKNYQTAVRNLESEGASVPREEQAAQFQRAIQTQSAQSGVQIISTSKLTSQTNQFFLELTQLVGVQATETALVDFLFNLGAGNSLIRVRELTLRPDPTRMQLTAQVKLVASYQKNLPTRSTTPAASTTTTPAKSAAPAPVAAIPPAPVDAVGKIPPPPVDPAAKSTLPARPGLPAPGKPLTPNR